MATMASALLRAARDASRAAAAATTRAAALASSRSARPGAAAAAATRAAAMASRSARATAAAARRWDSGVISPIKSSRNDARDVLCHTSSCADIDDAEYLPDDDGIIPTDKDLESDEAVWALYERWRKAFNKNRDQSEIARRFKIFRNHAQHVHRKNTYLPEDPKKAAIYIRKRMQI